MTAVDRVFMASPSHPLSIASHAVVRRSLSQRTQLSVNSSQRALSSLVFRRPPYLEPTHLLRKIINIGRCITNTHTHPMQLTHNAELDREEALRRRQLIGRMRVKTPSKRPYDCIIALHEYWLLG
ncbi:hypothetical protein PINS_up010091 [Pythium insidiosum]|nr:hypothetical protein PINS_up010091 [Pythium insidiosum]